MAMYEETETKLFNLSACYLLSALRSAFVFDKVTESCKALSPTAKHLALKLLLLACNLCLAEIFLLSGRFRIFDSPRNFTPSCHGDCVARLYIPTAAATVRAHKHVQGSNSRTAPSGTRRGRPSTTMQSFWFSLVRRLCSWATSSAKSMICFERSWSPSSFG